MNLLANPLIESLLAVLFDPALLAIALLAGLALTSGFVARSIEVCEDRFPVNLAAGTRSPARARTGPGA